MFFSKDNIQDFDFDFEKASSKDNIEDLDNVFFLKILKGPIEDLHNVSFKDNIEVFDKIKDKTVSILKSSPWCCPSKPINSSALNALQLS